MFIIAVTRVATFFLFFSIYGLAFSQDVETGIRSAEQSYEIGEYKKSEQVVDDLLLRDWELMGPERARLYLLKARLLYAFGRNREIAFWLRKADISDPAITLDPLRDPPSLVDSMRKIRETRIGDPVGQEGNADRGSFAMGVMPFGIGHMDAGKVREGVLFLSTESLLLLMSSSLKDGSGNTAVAVGAISFLGTYSYELLDMLPELAVRNREATQSVRWLLNFSPFGGAQAKNGELGKAFGFAALQSVLMTIGFVTEDETTRTRAFSVLGVTWAFSVIDGFGSYPRQYSENSSKLQFITLVDQKTPQFGARYRF